eukprot:CAMPEP_0181056620 /NCGR_PEP_ID=MMETSP1070-20121207/19816_1 /TAXON_ID=265543 /ORGANISM="Minutocellus polymorphus, Strain NH13" /LENGTH=375 /DNA_ID=CAMNT_0023135983 /DNA_START=70 /DNA_END=1197 /DNA_ORIENTATION=-
MSGHGKPGKGQKKKKKQYQKEREGLSSFVLDAIGYGGGGSTPPMPPLGQPGIAAGHNVEVSLIVPSNHDNGDVVELVDDNEVAVVSSPHDMGRSCPKLSDRQYWTLLFSVQKVVETYGGHLNYHGSGPSLDQIWSDKIFPALFDPVSGVLGQIGIQQPNGATAAKNWRLKYVGWLTDVAQKYASDIRKNPTLPMPPCVDKAQQQLNERTADALAKRSAPTKKRQKEADNADLESHSQRMGLENDGGRRPTKKLQASGLIYGQRADRSAVDPKKKVARHQDHVKGLGEEIKEGQTIEAKLNTILQNGITGLDDGTKKLQKANLVGATIQSLRAQAKGYQDNGDPVPAWIIAQIHEFEEEEQAIFKSRQGGAGEQQH